MDKNIYRSKVTLITLIPLGLMISYISSLVPNFIEKYYSRGIFKFSGQFLSTIFGVFPFSLGEMVIFCLVIIVIINMYKVIRALFTRDPKRKRILLSFTINILVFASTTYFGFIALWGVNYHRLPLANSIGLEVKPSPVSELYSLCENLIDKANSLRSENSISKDTRGVMELSKPIKTVFQDLNTGYNVISTKHSVFKGSFGRAKGVFFSNLMSYTGIAGVYFPFTGEANVNVIMPHSSIPSTAAHEMAHQRGFAREDEANYIAYLVCVNHPNKEYQYSGVLHALIYSMNALFVSDSEKYSELRKRYSEGVVRDLIDINEFWNKYEGPIDKLSSSINDAYLKSNLQEDGIKSYGRMVDLLLAEYRQK